MVARHEGAAAVVVVNSVETPWPFTMGDSKGEACGAGAARGRKIAPFSTVPHAEQSLCVEPGDEPWLGPCLASGTR